MRSRPHRRRKYRQTRGDGVKAKRCEYSGCLKNATYGIDGMYYCNDHRRAGLLPQDTSNPFNIGDFVTRKDEGGEAWEVRKTNGSLCYIIDVGEQVSGIIREWVEANTLELLQDDEDDDETAVTA